MTLDLTRAVDAVLELAALDNSHWEQALEQVLRVANHTLAVDRTSYWKVDDEPRMISCELGYVRSADAFEQGAVLLATDIPAYLAELEHAKVMRVEDVSTDPRTRDLPDYWSARKISSILDVPVWVGSKLAGVLCHEHAGALRRWKQSEVDFAVAIAQVLATALEARRRTRAEEEARRGYLLAHVSLRMARTLEEQVIAQHAVAASLPLLADWAMLDRFDDGTVERVAFQHADPQKQKLLEQYAAAYPPREDGPHLGVHAHRLGQSVLIPEVTDEALQNYNYSKDHLRWLHAIGIRSAMAVLVRVPESIDAVMTFVSAERIYDREALKFVEDYGERVGAALNNARLYRRSNEALLARDEFLTLAAHELRTPFTSLMISCERLVAAAAHSGVPEIVTPGERILRQSRRLTRLVNRMLDASLAEKRVPFVYLEDVDLVPLVREVVEEFASSKKGSAIELVLPKTVVGRWDGDQLQQVVGNLIENAMKYGGDRPIRVELAVEGKTATLSVVDHGIGIDPEVLPHLFERYERGASGAGYGGLGLGLFLSREIVTAHGGSIDVRSEKGIGSEFRVRLPGIVSLRRAAAGPRESTRS